MRQVTGVAWDQELDKGSIAYKTAAATENRIRVVAGVVRYEKASGAAS